MKTYGFNLAVCLFVLWSCQQRDLVSTDGALRTGSALPIGGHAHKFTVDSSVLLMTNLASASNLAHLTTGYGWGGSFPVSAFRVSEANQGVLLWYCFQGGPNPKMFLALEHLKDYDPANLPTQPISSELVGPTTVFRNTIPGNADVNTVREYILDQTGDIPGWVTFARDDVNRYINSADSVFREATDGNGERYNHYLFGFFSVRHEADFGAFLDRAGENGFIRYYFGYDENDRPNRIRIILMAVNPTPANGRSSRALDDDDTMQKSWPPPPDN